VDGKRRLPLISTEPRAGDRGDEGGEARPPWHWVGFGAVAIFTAWLPLSALAGALAARLAAAPEDDPSRLARVEIAIVALHMVALAVASFAGGLVVGRWGDPAGTREAALSGLAAALAAVAAAWATTGFSPGALFVVVVAVPTAAAGGWRGVRARAHAR
jgi:hypothetical protein